MDDAIIIVDAGDDRSLQSDGQMCDLPGNLQVPFEADTQGYGTMFTVQCRDDPITMLTMEILANPIERAMDVDIYTKLGEFKDAGSNPSMWTQVVGTSVIPAREGRGTIIPAENFTSFTMNPGELRSFFVSLKSSDLRYKRAADVGTGQPYISDGYLTVNVGVGLSGVGFANAAYPDRMFSGIFHYSHSTKCDQRISKTLVTLSFNAKPRADASKKSDIIQEINKLVGDAVQKIMGDDLVNLCNSHKVHIEGVNSQVSYFESGACPVAKWTTCVSIESEILLSHLDTITGGQLHYLFLHHAPKVTEEVNKGTLKVEYSGYQPLQTTMFVALKGVPVNVPLDEMQQIFVEQVTTDFLEEQTLGLTNAAIIGTKITNQRGPNFNTGRRMQEGATTTGDDWIEFTVDILAMLIPPYVGNADFPEVVEAAFRAERMHYVEDIKAGRFRPGSPIQGEKADYFNGINNVNARPPTTSYAARSSVNTGIGGLLPDPEKALGLGRTPIILISLGLIFASFGWLWWYTSARDGKEADTNTTQELQSDLYGKPLESESLSRFEKAKQAYKARKVKWGQDVQHDISIETNLESSGTTGSGLKGPSSSGIDAESSKRNLGDSSSRSDSSTMSRGSDRQRQPLESGLSKRNSSNRVQSSSSLSQTDVAPPSSSASDKSLSSRSVSLKSVGSSRSEPAPAFPQKSRVSSSTTPSSGKVANSSHSGVRSERSVLTARKVEGASAKDVPLQFAPASNKAQRRSSNSSEASQSTSHHSMSSRSTQKTSGGGSADASNSVRGGSKPQRRGSDESKNSGGHSISGSSRSQAERDGGSSSKSSRSVQGRAQESDRGGSSDRSRGQSSVRFDPSSIAGTSERSSRDQSSVHSSSSSRPGTSERSQSQSSIRSDSSSRPGRSERSVASGRSRSSSRPGSSERSVSSQSSEHSRSSSRPGSSERS